LTGPPYQRGTGIAKTARVGKFFKACCPYPSPPNKVCFGPKRHFSVMGDLRKHRDMFLEISHVMLTLENVLKYFITTKTWPEQPQEAYKYHFIT
jgi:hypothetical protein